LRLDGKVALVTWASRGIGRAIAVRLGQEGAAVIVNYSGNHEAASEIVSAIEEASGRALAIQGDVGKVVAPPGCERDVVLEADKLVATTGQSIVLHVAHLRLDDSF
jgi:NAD(P)-dependent dehydrogenase (short-subunit alcohol dehydrogenase family)